MNVKITNIEHETFINETMEICRFFYIPDWRLELMLNLKKLYHETGLPATITYHNGERNTLPFSLR